MSNTNTINNTALMLTAYEKYGSIGKDEYIQYFIDEELELDEQDIWKYNHYLSENYYEEYWCDLNDMFEGLTPDEIARACFYGDFHYAKEYHQFNTYGNVDSFYDYEIVKEMEADTDFLYWLIEEYELIDFEDNEVIEAIKEANRLVKLGY